MSIKYTLQSTLNFGKHKGKTVNQVLQESPGYIKWCLQSIDSFEMSDSDRNKVLDLAYQRDRQKYDDYYGAIDVYLREREDSR